MTSSACSVLFLKEPFECPQPWMSALFLLPVLLLCEWGLFYAPELVEAPQAQEICFVAPLLSGSPLWQPGLLTLTVLCLLAGQQYFTAQIVWKNPLRSVGQMGRDSLFYGLIPAGLGSLFLWSAQAGCSETVAAGSSLSLTSAASLSSAGELIPSGLWSSLLSCAGAGLFEEILFRCLLLLLIVGLFRGVGSSVRFSYGTAILVSSAAFAWAHEPACHLLLTMSSVGAGEGLSPFSLAWGYRFLAGIYLSGVCLGRGLGVAVGAHMGFNLWMTFVGIH